MHALDIDILIIITVGWHFNSATWHNLVTIQLLKFNFRWPSGARQLPLSLWRNDAVTDRLWRNDAVTDRLCALINESVNSVILNLVPLHQYSMFINTFSVEMSPKYTFGNRPWSARPEWVARRVSLAYPHFVSNIVNDNMKMNSEATVSALKDCKKQMFKIYIYIWIDLPGIL